MPSHTVAGNIVVIMSDNESLMVRGAADGIWIYKI